MARGISPVSYSRPRYWITLVCFAVVTVGAVVALVGSEASDSVVAAVLVGITGYGAGLVALLMARHSFARLNRLRAAPWMWVVVGVAPVLLAGLLPDGNVGLALASLVFGALMAVAILNPKLRGDPLGGR